MTAVAIPVSAPAQVVESYLADVLSGERPTAAADVVSNPVLRQKVAALRRAFPDLHVTTQTLMTDGDLVAVHFTAVGTHRGIYEGIPPTGRRWSATCTAIYRVVDESIVDFWETWDGLAILEQVGAVSRVAGASA